jgi:histidinol-phosphate aminotransferase
LERVKGSFNSYPLDRVANAGAVAAIHDVAHFDSTCARVVASRERLANELGQLGFEVLPSKANFLFVRHLEHDAAQLQAGLRERKILVRHFRQTRIAQFLRISIGTDVECDALVAAFKALLQR